MAAHLRVHKRKQPRSKTPSVHVDSNKLSSGSTHRDRHVLCAMTAAASTQPLLELLSVPRMQPPVSLSPFCCVTPTSKSNGLNGS